MPRRMVTIDGNEAAASSAYRVNEVIAIYPITPAFADGRVFRRVGSRGPAQHLGNHPLRHRDAERRRRRWRGARRAAEAGALTTTFTASQGLLLMIPNMFKIAGELTPTVFHVAARPWRRTRCRSSATTAT